METVVLGIDIGTSGSKGVIAQPDGTIVAQAECAHATSYPRPGWVEHDADAIWWADLRALCAELLPRAPAPAAVCVSGIGPCLLPADEAGSPLRPAILYGVDMRATAEIAELSERYGATELLERCGSLLTSQAVGPKLLWLRRHEPEIWERTRRLLMASSYLVQRLTGAYVLDHHSASQCTPLYDIRANRWIAERAEEIAPGLALPELRWPGEVAGVVTARAAAETGLPIGVPVAVGTIDAWAEALSVEVYRPGDTMLMYGTTMFLIDMQAEIDPQPTYWGTAGVFPGSFCLAGGMATSGALTNWLRSIAGEPPFEALLAEAEAAGPGAEGLVALPYFAGERTPIFDPDARGALLGLTLRHGRGHLYRALLEATAFGVRHMLEALPARERRITAVGGGTRQPLWPQIVADVTGQPQYLPAVTIGACYGDARLAAIAGGLLPAATTWNAAMTMVAPNEALRGLYDERYAIYRALYESTRALQHRLAAQG